MLHIVLGYINIILQLIYEPRDIVCQVVMVFIILFMLFKLFFFLRIIQKFSVITTMIIQCIADLKVFSLFFVIMIMHFGMAMNVLAKNPQSEYKLLNPFISNLLNCLRISVGDFDFTMMEKLQDDEQIVFWVLWLLVFLGGCLIFLNFIIAEVSASYEKVKEDIDALTYKERAKMVREAEDFVSDARKLEDTQSFPKYFVIREMEPTDGSKEKED